MIGRRRYGFLVFGAVLAATIVGSVQLDSAQARTRRRGGGVESSSGVPTLNVRGSCMDAQKFSTGDDKNLALNGCLQDEMNAKTELDKRWSTFKAKDKSNCVEQSRFPSPSYVEVLTCLEMSSDAMRNAPRMNGQPVPQIGGPVAPGLSSPTPSPSTASPATPSPSLKDKP